MQSAAPSPPRATGPRRLLRGVRPSQLDEPLRTPPRPLSLPQRLHCPAWTPRLDYALRSGIAIHLSTALRYESSRRLLPRASSFLTQLLCLPLVRSFAATRYRDPMVADRGGQGPDNPESDQITHRPS